MKASEARALSNKMNDVSIDNYLNRVYDKIAATIKKGDGYQTVDIESILPCEWILRTRIINNIKNIDGYEVSTYNDQRNDSYTNVSW